MKVIVPLMCGYSLMTIIAMIGILIIAAPTHAITDNDGIQTNEYYVDGDSVDVDIRLGDVEGYLDGFYRSSTSSLLSNVFITPDDPTVSKVYDSLKKYMVGMDDIDKANFLLSFVQYNIDYESDESIYGQKDYVQYPAETLLLKTGDCEDMALLLVTFYEKAGLDSVLIDAKGHTSVGVNVPLENGYYVTTLGSDSRYYIAESVGMYSVGVDYVEDVRFVLHPTIPYFALLLILASLIGSAFISYVYREDFVCKAIQNGSQTQFTEVRA